MQKYIPVLFLGILLLAGWHQSWWKSSSRSVGPVGKPVVARGALDDKDVTSTIINRHAKLEYTKHAICRMECRQVTGEEVLEILAVGKINPAKSNPHDIPCPTYALEGYSTEGQHLRIIIAPCDDEHAKVITCIDLDKDWACSCE